MQMEVQVIEEKNQELTIANEEAEKAKAEAIAAAKAKSVFLANMSHEIRTPINAILGMDTMILRESDDKDILEYAGNIQSASQTLLSLINDILDFSKIESGKMELAQNSYESVTFFKDIVRIAGVSETTIFNHLKKFEEVANLTIDRTGCSNKYSYTEPTKFFVTIDSSLLDTDVDRNVIGFLIRFKCWTRIASNIVDLSLNRIVHEIGVQHNTVYSALDAGLIDRSDKKLYFTLLHPSLTLL